MWTGFSNLIFFYYSIPFYFLFHSPILKYHQNPNRAFLVLGAGQSQIWFNDCTLIIIVVDTLYWLDFCIFYTVMRRKGMARQINDEFLLWHHCCPSLILMDKHLSIKFYHTHVTISGHVSRLPKVYQYYYSMNIYAVNLISLDTHTVLSFPIHPKTNNKIQLWK